MLISEFARATELSRDTVRFYVRRGLLKPLAGNKGGSNPYQVFTHEHVQTARAIRMAQSLGFSLREIRELVGLKNTRHPDCAHVERILEEKVVAVRAKITALRKLERELNQAMILCQANLRKGANGNAEDCPALDDISRSTGRMEK